MVDPARSNVQFSVRHVIGTLRGRFTDFEGVLEVDEDGVARAAGSVKAASINTNEPVRDGHLRDSPEFFDVERHPEITFSSMHVEHSDHGMPRVLGELTMLGVTRELALSVENHSALGDAQGEGAIALQLQGELNRKQFGLAWNQVMEAGGALVGDRVKIALEILAVRADPQ
jgi:polyisoprenoid-binding protein YceI